MLTRESKRVRWLYCNCYIERNEWLLKVADTRQSRTLQCKSNNILETEMRILQITNTMWYMAYRDAPFPITLSDHQRSSSYCKAFKMWFFVELLSNWPDFNWHRASPRGPPSPFVIAYHQLISKWVYYIEGNCCLGPRRTCDWRRATLTWRRLQRRCPSLVGRRRRRRRAGDSRTTAARRRRTAPRPRHSGRRRRRAPARRTARRSARTTAAPTATAESTGRCKVAMSPPPRELGSQQLPGKVIWRASLECKKTLQGPGLRPGLHQGSWQRSRSWWGLAPNAKQEAWPLPGLWQNQRRRRSAVRSNSTTSTGCGFVVQTSCTYNKSTTNRSNGVCAIA